MSDEFCVICKFSADSYCVRCDLPLCRSCDRISGGYCDECVKEKVELNVPRGDNEEIEPEYERLEREYGYW